VIEDIIEAKDRVKKNVVSLNQEVRRADLAKADAKQKQRNVERKTRFMEMAGMDKDNLKFYKVTLDDLNKGASLHPYDPTSDKDDFMRRAKDDTAELDDTPEWPSGLDPMKRESLHVLKDLVDLTENAKVVGIDP